MGMFDYISVNPKFIPDIPQLENSGYTQELSVFQTKSLENALYDYYIDEDGKLSYDKVEYEFVENTESPTKGKFHLPFFQNEISRERIPVDYTGIINVCELFYNDPCGFDCDISKYNKDEIFIEIEFKCVDGVVSECGKATQINITPLKEVLERIETYNNIRYKRDNDQIYKFVRKCYFFINRVINKLQKFMNWLNKYEPK